MRPVRGARSLIAVLAVAAAAVGVWRLAAGPRTNAAAANAPQAADFTVDVGAAPTGQPIPPGFLGLSMEYWALENYAGQNPRAVDPVLAQLIRNLSPDGSAVLRIGGVTTDRTWWPVRGVPRSPGAFYTLTRNRLQVARSLAQATRARLILGVQFEADNQAEAAAEARAMLGIVGRSRIAGLELGNEPELYPYVPFYGSHYARPRDWGFAGFVQDFRQVAAAMGRVPAAGPATGSPSWMSSIGQFLDGVPGLAVAAVHRYPLQGCSVPPSAPNYPTMSHLLADPAVTGAADPFSAVVNAAHAHHVKVRYDEMNTVACGNGRGVADTFGAALWSVSALFEAASNGADGVNIHTYPGAPDQLFTIRRRGPRWQASVAPEYYGLMLFEQAAPTGSRILPVSTSESGTGVRAWAVRTRSGAIHVVLINTDTARRRAVQLGVAGAGGVATSEVLQAPQLTATSRISLGGRSFARNGASGRLTGRGRSASIAPRDGRYGVELAPATAVLLTVR